MNKVIRSEISNERIVKTQNKKALDKSFSRVHKIINKDSKRKDKIR